MVWDADLKKRKKRFMPFPLRPTSRTGCQPVHAFTRANGCPNFKDGTSSCPRVRTGCQPVLHYGSRAAKKNAAASRRWLRKAVEVRAGFEPANRGFADLSLNHLGTSPPRRDQALGVGRTPPPPSLLDTCKGKPHRGPGSCQVVFGRRARRAHLSSAPKETWGVRFFGVRRLDAAFNRRQP